MWFFFKVCFSSSSINSRFLTTCFFTPPALSYRVAILHVPAKWTFHTLIQTHTHSLSYTKYKLFSPICEHSHLTHSLPQGLLMPLSIFASFSVSSWFRKPSWVMTTLVPALPHVCTVLCSWLWQRAIAMFSLAIFPVGCLLSFHSICLFHLLRLSWPRILHLISSLSAWWHPVNEFDWYLKLEKDDSVADIWVCVMNRCSWQCYYVPGMITWQSHSK